MIGLEYILKLYEKSYTELANELGIKKQNITCWLSGKQSVSKKHLPELSNMFNVPEEYFQKELSEIEEIDIQIFRLEKEIAESTFIGTDTIFDSEHQEWIEIEREYHNDGAIEHLRLFELDRQELQLIQKLKASITKSKNIWGAPDDISADDFISTKQANIKIYNRLIEIVNAKQISTKLLCEIIRAVELADSNLSSENGIFGEENPFDVTSVSDEKQIVQDLFAVLRRYLNDEKVIQQKNIQEAKEIQLLFVNTDDSEDLY